MFRADLVLANGHLTSAQILKRTSSRNGKFWDVQNLRFAHITRQQSQVGSNLLALVRLPSYPS
jgi:hypothetical protein